MSAKFELILILTCITLFFISVSGKMKVKHGPGGMSFNDTTTCDEFTKFARFNPYSVLYEKWFVFFYWAPPKSQETYIFTFPTANHTKHLHKILDGKTVLPVDWSARHILMEDHRNVISLLVERSDRGEYWLYLLYKVIKGNKIRPRDVRLKQTADNRLIGFMDCDKMTVLAMSRINDVPPKKRLQDEAARLGFRGRRGKSYLYQGHEWMPIPEDDDEHYWHPEKKKKVTNKSSEEVQSSEQSSKEEESPNINVSKETKENEKKNENMLPSHDEEKLIPEKHKEKKNNNVDIQRNFDEEKWEPEEIEKNNAEMQANIDEEELKERCIEIKPEYWNDPLIHEPIKEPDYLPIAKEQKNNLETNMLEAMRPTNTPDSALSDKKAEEILETKLENKYVNNKLEDHQVRNQPKKAKKSIPGNLKSTTEDTQVPEESDDNDCACYKGHYVKSTAASYMVSP